MRRVPLASAAAVAWMTQAACRDLTPGLFFPFDDREVSQAKAVCDSCPVIDRCLDYALEERIDHGVWGGLSESQRRRITRRTRAG